MGGGDEENLTFKTKMYFSANLFMPTCDCQDCEYRYYRVPFFAAQIITLLGGGGGERARLKLCYHTTGGKDPLCVLVKTCRYYIRWGAVQVYSLGGGLAGYLLY
jgi:hypothetical protein